jgi:hypothetical protein
LELYDHIIINKSKIDFSIKKDENVKYTRVFVVIGEELQEFNIIKNYIAQCKKYYEINKPRIKYEKYMNFIFKYYRKLQKERAKSGIIITKKLQKQEKYDMNNKLREIREKYDLSNDFDEEWTDEFELFCKYQNFDFDDVLLFVL